jgi:hypothetical protein
MFACGMRLGFATEKIGFVSQKKGAGSYRFGFGGFRRRTPDLKSSKDWVRFAKTSPGYGPPVEPTSSPPFWSINSTSFSKTHICREFFHFDLFVAKSSLLRY